MASSTFPTSASPLLNNRQPNLFPTLRTLRTTVGPSRLLTSASPPINLHHSTPFPPAALPIKEIPLPIITLSDSKYKTKPDSDSDSDIGQKRDIPKNCPLQNPFLMGGTEIPYEEQEDDEAKYARLDMPGICKEGLKLWVEDHSLWIHGVESNDEKVALSKHQLPRKFYGEIDVEEDLYRVDEIKAELKDGVLKLVIPKVPLQERNLLSRFIESTTVVFL